jgi:hypothetical protein
MYVPSYVGPRRGIQGILSQTSLDPCSASLKAQLGNVVDLTADRIVGTPGVFPDMQRNVRHQSGQLGLHEWEQRCGAMLDGLHI